ncbi:MAG TPA: FAD binding domain-containing protein [Nitrososphaerales archaeon]|nr:FAD binding domain-containing protein [Nitrososphaerales archaeon]
MAVFRPKEFILSSDKGAILEKLNSGGKHAHVIAGGTGFYELARRGYIPEVKSVVSIMKLGLSYINSEKDSLRIGATATLQELLESEIGDSRGFEALGDALREIRPVQVRNVATVGGEVCISVPIVDLPIALLACGSSIVIASLNGKDREMKLEDFYVDAFLTRLKNGEIVKEVSIPKKEKGHTAFVKIGRTAYDFNLINAAVSLTLENSSTIGSLSVYLGGIKRIPVRAIEFEKRLWSKIPDEKMIIAAAEASFAKLNLLPSVHGSSDYKKAILPIILRDCLMKAYERALQD